MYNESCISSTIIVMKYIRTFWDIIWFLKTFQFKLNFENIKFRKFVRWVWGNALFSFDLLIHYKYWYFCFLYGYEWIMSTVIKTTSKVLCNMSLWYLRLPFFSSSSLPKSTLIAKSGSEKEYKNNKCTKSTSKVQGNIV